RRDLAALRPDLLVLGGIGILKAPLLEIPQLGTLNAHPGLLPWVRGTGVVANALQRGIAVGVTVHRVNTGIDRGAILDRRLVEIRPGADLSAIESSADRLASRMLAEQVLEVAKSATLTSGLQQSGRWPICAWLDAEVRAI